MPTSVQLLGTKKHSRYYFGMLEKQEIEAEELRISIIYTLPYHAQAKGYCHMTAVAIATFSRMLTYRKCFIYIWFLLYIISVFHNLVLRDRQLIHIFAPS